MRAFSSCFFCLSLRRATFKFWILTTHGKGNDREWKRECSACSPWPSFCACLHYSDQSREEYIELNFKRMKKLWRAAASRDCFKVSSHLILKVVPNFARLLLARSHVFVSCEFTLLFPHRVSSSFVFDLSLGNFSSNYCCCGPLFNVCTFGFRKSLRVLCVFISEETCMKYNSIARSSTFVWVVPVIFFGTLENLISKLRKLNLV